MTYRPAKRPTEVSEVSPDGSIMTQEVSIPSAVVRAAWWCVDCGFEMSWKREDGQVARREWREARGKHICQERGVDQ